MWPLGAMFSKVMLFGDSLTQRSFSVENGGWGAMLSDHFQRRADFMNRGFSGYNTEWAGLILPRLLLQDQPDLAVVFFGSNDATLAEVNPHQHVDLDRYKANLDKICLQLMSTILPSSSLLLVAPPPVCEERWREYCTAQSLPNGEALSNEVTGLYASAVLELGVERGVTTLDLYGELSKRGNLQEYLIDGLHLSRHGNEVVGSLMILILEEKLKATATVFSDWKDIDPSDARNTLGL